MSSVSQTPARKPLSFGLRFGLIMGVVVVIVGLSLGGAWRAVMALALSARPHAPNLSLFMQLTPAIKVHLVAALLALGLGAVLMFGRKGRTFHRIAGWVWVVLALTTAGATPFITSLNHGRWSILHLFTGWVLLILPLAVIWAKRHDVARHRRTMMGLFYGGFAINLLIAFIPGRTMWQMFFG
ncbi:MAG: hypothetical protein KKE02_20500 [Alphaproteobacteria bacterium]|nr:hypothetical protein [Alphaproteobacteria bacterium]MBU1514234.1 hypothetical protein [Alphaproteobacteria bacterium]MBU2093320.1 hypothetical protein [Alphaproteobacteria bacterium]MBU2153411.1 hypothetical protein [Alphaproteobacteria bacterium]MBU2307102.1 hypothetical protein [Alphaproteobacteria bacterium]